MMLSVSNKIASNNKTLEIGREKNMRKDPCDIKREALKEFSSIGDSTSASTSGAGSKSNLRIRYPNAPKNIIMKISTTLSFRHIPRSHKKGV
jgi:hypothetical protein